MSRQFQLTSATVLGDGQNVRLQFEAGVAVGQAALVRSTDCGFFDETPGIDAGLTVQVNGVAAEIMGVRAEDWNMPLAWVLPPTTGGSISAGSYVFLLAIADAGGNEIYTSPPIYSYSNESGVAIPASGSVTFGWRKALLAGQTVRIYAATSSPIYTNLKLVGSYSSVGATSYTLNSFNGSGATWASQSVCLKVNVRTSSPLPCGSTVTVSAPANLVVDGLGNGTAAVSTTATNQSVVNANGFLAVESFTFSKTVYISYSHGTDSPDAGTLAKPYKTKNYADSQVSSSQKNVRFCWLRGDTWPADQWVTAHWGTSLTTPTLFESYWNPAYGADPGTRPVLQDSAIDGNNPNGWFWFGQGDTTNQGRATYGTWPYQYFRGLAFVRDTSLIANGDTWVTNKTQDYVIISDCLFQNICLVAGYGSAQFIASIGCMIHKSIIHTALASTVTNSKHVSGIFIAHCGDFTFKDTLFSHNGWKGLTDPSNNDQFNHNDYQSSMSRDTIVDGCWVFDGCLSGVQMRGGGGCWYSVFAGNASHYSGGDTFTIKKCVFQDGGIYNSVINPADSTNPEARIAYNIFVGNSGIDEKRVANTNYDGIHFVHWDSIGSWSNNWIAIRHNTSVDAGSYSLGNKLPNQKALVDHNLIVNRPGTGVDYQGTPLRSARLGSGSFDVNTQAQVNYNAYQISTQNSAFYWPDVSTKSFAAWQAKGRDVNGIALASTPAFSRGTYKLAGWAQDNSLGSSLSSLDSALRTRQAGSWGVWSDASKCYQAFAAAYTPTLASVPAIGSARTAHYGAADNRPAPQGRQGGRRNVSRNKNRFFG
jgi:hypothetical protein